MRLPQLGFLVSLPLTASLWRMKIAHSTERWSHVIAGHYNYAVEHCAATVTELSIYHQPYLHGDRIKVGPQER
jgi:hypothetical protein